MFKSVPSTVFVILLLLSSACTKEEYVIDENFSVPGLEPSLAIPLANTDFGLGELIMPLGLEDEVINEPGTQMALMFRERLFEIGLEDLVQLPPLEVEESYVADAITAAVFNATLEGADIPISESYNLPFDFENGEQLDSIRLGDSNLSIELQSSFRHDLSITLTIPEMLTPTGEMFSTQFQLDYTGDVPVMNAVDIDVSDHLLDFSAPDNENELNILADFIVTHSGEMTNAGDSVYFELALSSNSIRSAYGFLGQFTGIAEIDTQRVDVFENIDAENIYFADPAIELDLFNSSGIPMEIDFTSLFAPTNSITQLITGGALEDIPVVLGAITPGTTALTEHRIDNSNTDPSLSDMLSEGPVDLIYTAAGETNPEGFSHNFILDTSKVSCDATVILPLYGAVDGYRFADTLDVDLSTDLGLGEEGMLTIDDIESVQIRIIADNGLPIDTRMQLVFLDSLQQASDSLFMGQSDVPVLLSGIVDHNLPETHPDHGRVVAARRSVTDVILTPSRLEELTEGGVKYLVIKIVGSTSEGNSGEMVRFYPEDRLAVQVSAKIETEIDISE
ncbi:MAG: hypothetical protein HKN79_12385 [Flavobacteriales bacterium]|nr:hypothetical protein [Flavobacteriales bacterium]